MSERAGAFCVRAEHENVRMMEFEGAEVESRAMERREIILKAVRVVAGVGGDNRAGAGYCELLTVPLLDGLNNVPWKDDVC